MVVISDNEINDVNCLEDRRVYDGLTMCTAIPIRPTEFGGRLYVIIRHSDERLFY